MAKQNFLYLWLGTGLLIILIAIPLILRRIPPNGFYGVRVPKTLNNPDIWYPVNHFCGWTLLWSGIIASIVSVALFFVTEFAVEAYSNICAIVVCSLLVISCISSLVYLRRF